MASTNITIVMVTRGRYELVCSHLTYLKGLKFCGEIIVVDGSDVSSLHLMGCDFPSSSVPFNLTYIFNPRLSSNAWNNMAQCIALAALKVKTTYVALCFDDDFLNPIFLDRACEILDSNPDVGYVVGNMALLELNFSKRVGFYFEAFHTQHPCEIKAETFLPRLVKFLNSGFQLCYAVVRSDIFSLYVPNNYANFSLPFMLDWNWYIAILSSGEGVEIPEYSVFRLRHEGHMQDYYKRSPASLSQMSFTGELQSNIKLLSDRISILSGDRIKCPSADLETNSLDSLALSTRITFGQLSKLIGKGLLDESYSQGYHKISILSKRQVFTRYFSFIKLMFRIVAAGPLIVTNFKQIILIIRSLNGRRVGLLSILRKDRTLNQI